MVEPASSPVADVHGVRRGSFTVSRLHRSGSAPHRVLLIGSRALLAPAGRARAEAFGSRVTDRVWLRTRRGVDIDMVWEPRPVLTAIRQGSGSARLWRYDAVVIVVAAHPVGMQDRWRLRGLQYLLRRVTDWASASTHVLLVSFGDESRMRRRGRHVEESTDARVLDTGASAVSNVTRVSTSADERVAADVIARHLLVPLAAAAAVRGVLEPGHRWDGPDEEIGRQRAVDDLALRGRRVEERLQQVVDTAREAFGSVSAEISVVDRDQRWALASSGLASEPIARGTTMCHRSIQRPAPTVIGDLWEDPELRGDPLVAANAPMRFYASYPIESIDGYRIGTLCVWDDTPHDVADFDVSALRDLALLAEAEIISGAN